MTDRDAHEVDSGDRWRDRFSDYYDGEMKAGEQVAFEDWLAEDDANQAEYDAFERSLELLHSLRPAPAPKDFVRGVTQDINRRSRGAFFNDRWVLGFRVPYEVFGAVLLALFAAIYVFGGAEARYSIVGSDDSSAGATHHDEADVLGGHAAGSHALTFHLSINENIDLADVARTLRVDGYDARPHVEGGVEFVSIEVVPDALVRLGERLFVATGEDRTVELATLDVGESHIVRVLVGANAGE